MAKYGVKTLITYHLQDFEIGGGNGQNPANGYPINGIYEGMYKKRNFEGEVTLYVFIPEEMPETKTKGLYHGYIGINESVGEIYAGYYPNTSVYISFSPDDDWYINDIRVV